MHTATHSMLSLFVHRKVSHLAPLLLWAILFALTTPTSQAQNAKEAATHFQEGRYDDALEIYRHLALENPDDPRFTYNAGVAAFKAGQLGEAMEQFDAASLAPDLNVQQQAHYNMANTLFRAGEATDDFEQKSEVWKQAVQRYQHALTINEEDNLAQDNLDFVKQRLEELEQQQQEEQENQEQQNDEENEDDSSEDQQSESDSQDQQDQEQNESDQNEENQEEGEQEQQQEQDQGDENKEKEPQDGKEKEEPKDPAESQQSEQKPGEETEGQGQPQEGKMTPEQAKQLLDAERDQAKAMIFSPPENQKSRNRNFKDW
jgi:Ca-activated chloride channel homolog